MTNNELSALFEIDESQRVAKRCVIGIAVDALPDKYRKILEQQLFNTWKSGGSTDYDIADVLTRAGYRASPTSVNRHRNYKCVCPKEAK